MFSWNFLVTFIFVVIILVQLCVTLVRNNMFYEKQGSSILITIFYYVIDIMYIYSWKQLIINLIHYGDATNQK